jgi:hypothetical protein
MKTIVGRHEAVFENRDDEQRYDELAGVLQVEPGQIHPDRGVQMQQPARAIRHESARYRHSQPEGDGDQQRNKLQSQARRPPEQFGCGGHGRDLGAAGYRSLERI